MGTDQDGEATQAIRRWLDEIEAGSSGECLLHATLDAEEAIVRFRERIEAR